MLRERGRDILREREKDKHVAINRHRKTQKRGYNNEEK